MARERGDVAETENESIRQQIIEQIVIAIRRHYWDDGCSLAGTLDRFAVGEMVLIRGDRRWRLIVGDARQWVEDVVFYRRHITIFPEFMAQ